MGYISGRLRFEVLKRDGFLCHYCGMGPRFGVPLVIDHVVPVSAGGPTIYANLVAACHTCNAGKGSIALENINAQPLPEETKKRLIQELAHERADERSHRVSASICSALRGCSRAGLSDETVRVYFSLLARGSTGFVCAESLGDRLFREAQALAFPEADPTFASEKWWAAVDTLLECGLLKRLDLGKGDYSLQFPSDVCGVEVFDFDPIDDGLGSWVVVEWRQR